MRPLPAMRYKVSFMAAYSLRVEPQTRMRMYMGTTAIS